MTVEELAMHLIEHAEEEQTCIGLDRAQQIIDLLDKSEPLPPDLTADSLMKAWNEIILFDYPEP